LKRYFFEGGFNLYLDIWAFSELRKIWAAFKYSET